jgi:hypothetical protein
LLFSSVPTFALLARELKLLVLMVDEDVAARCGAKRGGAE